MKCPVCGKEARTHIFYCAQCAAYVHEKCWSKHDAEIHQQQK